MTPDQLPMPLPPEAEPESPRGLKALLEHRILLAALAVVLFFVVIFGLGWFFKGQTRDGPGAPGNPGGSPAPGTGGASPG